MHFNYSLKNIQTLRDLVYKLLLVDKIECAENCFILILKKKRILVLRILFQTHETYSHGTDTRE